MSTIEFLGSRLFFGTAIVLALCGLIPFTVRSNPVGGTVTQGAATFNSSGSKFVIQTTTDKAVINWQSFNIGVGETTTFVQPSSSSLVWNQINDVNPSQILGNLNANGYVILQNQAGFYVGGQAAISTRGLLMTTAPITVPNLATTGAWQFNAPPPTAKIVNYGQVTAAAGGSVFLIAHDIENHGTITAPAGDIGLYAGRQVLITDRPDGRGLSAKVTIPEGSVDNSGKLIADAGTIAMHAQVVNQRGLLQADSVREVNGTIELVASDSLKLGANSTISAKGDSQGTSPGGIVILSSDNSFADTPAASINVAGGSSGGKNGLVEVFGQGTTLNNIQSTFDGGTASEFAAHEVLLVNPFDITLSLGPTETSSAYPNLNVDELSAYSKITLFANGSINLNALWNLPDTTDPKGSLKLQAKNNINITDDGTGNINGILAGKNRSLTLVAGTELTSADNLQDGIDRIFLQGLSFIQGQNGSIELTAANEVFVDDGSREDSQTPYDDSRMLGNGITTVAGGSISVSTTFGDINTGANPLGFAYSRNAPYYSVSKNPGELGGISTAGGGDVTLSAGGNITSYMPLRGNTSDAGSGAFGGGNVSVTAGGSVFGHYVVTDGQGVISAGQDAGASISRNGFALSLVKGSWSVFAPNGSIHLQEVRNPNGTFNNEGGPGTHLFDYDPQASLFLEAGNQVEITGAGLPRGNLIAGQTAPPIILPPTLQITAGAGGVKINNSITLFPSSFSELNISTSGDFIGTLLVDGSRPELLMSDSGSKQWTSPYSFLEGDHASTPVELNNPDPSKAATVTVGGSMNNLILATSKQTQVNVGGDMNNTAFNGQNLHPGDVTSINVAGKIFNRNLYTFTVLDKPIPIVDTRTGSQWDTIFDLLIDPRGIANPDPSQDPSKAVTAGDLLAIANRVLLFGASTHNPGFVYNPATLRFGFAGKMPTVVKDALEGSLQILKIGQDGLPVVQNGRFVTVPVTFVPASAIEALYNASQDVPTGTSIAGYKIGGPGQFKIHAGSLDLGTTDGILSLGATANPSLASLTTSGASVNVNVDGDITMFTSRIASLFGGDVTVYSGGSMNLGSQELTSASSYAFGVYTTGHSDVSVTARGDININGSRIASYNGGDVSVESLNGNVNVGSGGTSYVSVPIVRIDPKTGLPSIAPTYIYGSGVVTVSLTKDLQTEGGNPLPGNISINTPNGDIVSSFAGILQLPLDGSLEPGASITLNAGTPGGHAGNIDLGNSGVIGGAITLTANGDIKGLIISRESSTVKAAQNFSGTLLSAGTANVSAGGSLAGTIIGVGGVNASAGGGISAALLSQNVSVAGGAAQSTLGSSASATAASQSASQQASSDTREKLADTGKPGGSDDDKKKNLMQRPVLTRRVGRVTVFVPPA